MRLSVARSLALSFGGTIVLLGVVYAAGVYTVQNLTNTHEHTLEHAEVARELVRRQVDHLEWVASLSDSLHEHTDVSVQLNDHKCGLGTWLYGDGAVELVEAEPELGEHVRALQAPHAALHASAHAIRETIAAGGDDAEVLAIFKNETKPALAIVQSRLDTLIDALDRAAAESSEKAAATASTLAWVQGGTAGVAVLVGIAAAVFCTRRITRPIRAMRESLAVAASGDLTVHTDVLADDELGDLTHSFNELVGTLNSIVSEVATATDEVAGATSEIVAASEEMARSLDSQRAQSEQVSAAIEQMSASVGEIASKAEVSRGLAASAGEHADEGADIVQRTRAGNDEIREVVEGAGRVVNELGERAESIGGVIATINEIADQTNLLALNAAIEAARAGEHGRGFSVVADEVRKLAERTTAATSEVAGSISAIQNQTREVVARMDTGAQRVDAGVSLAADAATALARIREGAEETTHSVASMAGAAEQQAATVTEITQSISKIAAVTAEAATASAQSASACTALGQRAEHLRELVGHFRIAK